MTKPKIRQASSQDLTLIQELDKICLPGCSWYPADYSWCLWSDDFLVGYACLTHSRQWDKCGYLCRSGILPEFRGKGLQKRLIRARIRKARELGWQALVTDTRKNPASANSLIACGFKMYEPQNPWSFKDACYWRLWL